jgi:O-antigen/teichoic acid export membrane protein
VDIQGTGSIRQWAASALRTLPPGTIPVGIGLVASGLSAYGFLAVSARALGPERYSGVSTLWALVFLAAPGLFWPLEQEVGRAVTARRVRGVGGRPVIFTAARLGMGLSAVILVAALATSPLLVPTIFDSQYFLLAAFAVSIPAYCVYFLARGALAGHGRFSAYGLILMGEGLARVGVAAVLALLSVRVAGAYGLLVGLPCLAGLAIGLAGRRATGLLEAGPRAPLLELSSAIGTLLAASVLAQALVNVGPLAVRVLAGSGQTAIVGTFLNGLVISRIPLFFFQAIQAALLPALAAHAARGNHDRFRNDLVRLTAAVSTLAAVAIVANWAIGPAVVERVFGAAYRIGHADMLLLAAASGAYMVALALAQGLIALSRHALTIAGWFAGMVTFIAVTAALGGGPAIRVECGLVAGSLVALVVMGALLAREMAGVRETTATSRAVSP